MKGITGNRTVDAYTRAGLNPVGAARPAERPEPSAASSGPSAAAQVTISSRARDMATESADASVDAAKVEHLRQRISDGSFQVDPQKIAQQMIHQLG